MKKRKELAKLQKAKSDIHSFSTSSISLIFFLLDQLSDKIYAALIGGFFGKVFTSYSKEQAVFSQSTMANCFGIGDQIRHFFRKIKMYLSKSFENSLFMNRCHRFGVWFLSIPLKAVGNFFLSFGIYSVLIYFWRIFISDQVQPDWGFFAVGAFSCLIGFPMILSRESIAQAILKSKSTEFIFVRLFGFRKESLESEPYRGRWISSGLLLLGMALGLLTFVISPQSILLGIAGIILLSLLFVMPEIGVILSVFMLPFFYFFSAPSLVLGLLIFISTLSYLIKLIRGKRTFKFELMDFAVILFGFILFFSGAITAGGQQGYREVLLSCVLIFGYFLTVNLMRTQIWLTRCIKVFVFSGTITSVLGILQYMTKKFNSGAWLDLSYFSDIEGRVDALFENPNMLAAYLVLVVPFAVTLTIQAYNAKERLLYLFSCLSVLSCTIITWSRGAWLAVLLELFVLAMMYSKKTLRYLFLLCFAVPFLPILLPSSVTNRFLSILNFSDSSIVYRMYTWKGSWNVAKHYFWSGIGYGTEAYQNVYPQFAYAGMEAAEHSHNLALQILIGMGIGGLLVLVFTVFLFFQMNLEHLKISQNAEHRRMIMATICTVLATLVMGCFDFVWYNYRIFFMFWVLLGIACSYTRVGQEDIRRHAGRKLTEEDAATLDLSM